jgi:hypothetical protein
MKQMRKTISTMIATAALMISGSLNVGAQSSQPGAPAAQPADTIKVTGCLKNEKDVAGLKPNVVERTGITEDYILTDVKLSPDTKSAIGLGAMYEIEGIAEADLKAHLNHQIEVTGRLSKVETGTAATAATNRGDVPDFYATSFKMLAATCPMK